MKPIMLIFSLLCTPMLAAPTGFAERARFASGAAIIESAAGGEYVYARQSADNRVTTRPVLTTVPERQAYVFFSAEEEQALLHYRDQQLARLHKEARASVRARRDHAVVRFEWPKVIVRGREICVPELASGEADDWRDHLVCHAQGGSW